MNQKLPKVAYLCMEYAVNSDIKTYAGGLGILAGDYLKGAKDEQLPIVGVGLKWKQGYTRQHLNDKDRVVDSYENHPYDGFEDTGKSVTVRIRNRDVVCKIWKATDWGVSELYLLDTDVPENADTWITGQLYGWFGEERVAQEMVLGIGGVRALKELGIDVDVYHFNEGHAVLAAIELLQNYKADGLSFEHAWEKTRAKVVFTTHTPVIQGNESHPPELLSYMGAVGDLSQEEVHQLGGTPFNMTVAALQLCRASNGVAQLHGETARKMWAHVEKAPEIIGITNGIHKPTWVDSRIQEAKDHPDLLWDVHMSLKNDLIAFVKERTGQQLDSNKMIIGFARRAVAYKRSNLIFQAGDAVIEALKAGKIQVVFSGKAHPLDDGGKDIVHEIVAFSRQYPGSIVFLEDYDMDIGAMLTRGSDVWLNNPRRPQEACGTSGMKAAMNGVLNLSVLDGWWPEACQHGVNGWAIGDDHVPESFEEQDARDAKFLGETLIQDVLPTYYDDRQKWITMMQESINSVTEPFSVDTMLKSYFEKLY
ncbi:alpha-glucan family phosphorylase [Pseudobacteriovorax antillogorgiicola]|uniref:glycogen phosphorylase n=1 Tax=Pseudobacteriovorax antillogorgiicola TaxID=1513793 RepID=A0A1Y6BSF6_9BACT|nr:alpha-glucan family phosphorylase [Pseudobacteriovorax antillogorgiicola]TCS53096.1 starch phosphorylase [Pseudobacteriovorax antillogorgiicola]SMF25940.1 starch phosphorylase [Pseudobacteriovorax antillogorgiicola]